MLCRVRVEHPLRDGTMQARDTTLQHRKSRAAQFCRRIEINASHCGADIDVIFHGEIKGLGRAPFAHLHVFVGILALRHVGARDIGDGS